MFAKPLYGRRIAPACSYCLFSRKTDDPHLYLCEKRGAVDAADQCRRFRYDITARVPSRPLPLGDFAPEDFSLD